MSRYLEAIQKGVVIFDGAMGSSLQERQLSEDPKRRLHAQDFGGREGWNEGLVLHRPDVLEELHASFLSVGADVIETDTFGGSHLKLEEYGAGDQTYELNFKAAALARKVADQFSSKDKPRFVAGSMGPTGFLPSTDDPSLGKLTYADLVPLFEEQAKPLIEGGSDLLIIETTQDILELKAAITGVRRCFKTLGRSLPIQAQVTLDTTGRMLLGTDIGAALTILEALHVDVIGLNCSTGPQEMRDSVRHLSENCRKPISIIPNAGIPLNRDGQAFYPLDPDSFAKHLRDFVMDFGIEVVGGCCGTTPAHIQALVEALKGVTKKRRGVMNHARQPFAASTMKAVSLLQEPAPTLFGERLNAQGSRRMKKLLLENDYATIGQIARAQTEQGAHLLDVCLALTERADEAEQMRILVKQLAQQIDAPLVIDSTEAKVIQAALETYGGRAVVNSINMENGLERIEAICPLVEEHGAAVVALTIDKDSGGMAKTADLKFAVAKKIHDYVSTHYKIAPQDLIFDALTFTLATGEAEFRDSAKETLEGIRQIKKGLPGVLTTLGVSNVSFGLNPAARRVLNSVFLHHAVEAGLDTAIVNPAEIVPYFEVETAERAAADDLIFNKKPEALATLIEMFESKTVQASAETIDENFLKLKDEEKIHYKILHRKGEGIEALIDAVRARRDPVDILNNVLLPAMKEVGDKFGAGELILPFVLQSAEVMKKAVAHLEQFLEKTEGSSKGTIVLATVYGDVHDIGKNLVKTILSNNGFTVHDLGKQVPIQTIIEKAEEFKADAIGLSALLVSTSRQMPACVEELHKKGWTLPVLIGGAAINRKFGFRTYFVNETPYAGGVFYAKDAFGGLDIMNTLMNKEERVSFQNSVLEEARKELVASQQKKEVLSEGPSRSAIVPVKSPPKPPFLGVKTFEKMDLSEVYPLIDHNSLFRLSWGVNPKDKKEYDKLIQGKFRPLLKQLQTEAIEKKYFEPKVLYGFFPCHSKQETIEILDPKDSKTVLAQFKLPRQVGLEHLCLADYVQAHDSGVTDYMAFHVVTVGDHIDELCNALQDKGDYTQGYYLHGLGVATAEALAEWAHRQIRNVWGLPAGQGQRYSFGYPACPDLADQKGLFSLLEPEKHIDVHLTEAFQMVPVASTSALIFHHPQASYFAVKNR